MRGALVSSSHPRVVGSWQRLAARLRRLLASRPILIARALALVVALSTGVGTVALYVEYSNELLEAGDRAALFPALGAGLVVFGALWFYKAAGSEDPSAPDGEPPSSLPDLFTDQSRPGRSVAAFAVDDRDEDTEPPETDPQPSLQEFFKDLSRPG